MNNVGNPNWDTVSKRRACCHLQKVCEKALPTKVVAGNTLNLMAESMVPLTI